jgi:tetratricopeptide (TPR) repeat protein
MHLNKYPYALFFCLLCSCYVWSLRAQAQNSLAAVSPIPENIQQMPADTAKVLALIDLSTQSLGKEFSNALIYAKAAYELAQQLGYADGLSMAQDRISSAYENLGDYEKSLEYKLKSLRTFEETNKPRGKMNQYNNIGVWHFRRGNYQEALTHYLKAYELAQTVGKPADISIYLLNIGEVYQVLGDNEKALDYEQRCIELSQKLGIEDNIAYAKGIMGKVYESQGKWNQALEYQQEALRIFRELDDPLGVVEYLISIAELHQRQARPMLAERYAQEAVTLADELGSMYWKVKALQVLAQTAVTRGDFGAAYRYQTDYVALQDSLEGIEKQKNIQRLHALYEVEQKETQIALLQQQAELAMAAQQRAALRTRIIALVAAGVMLLLVLSLVFMSLLRKNIQKRKEAHQALFEKNQTLQKLYAELNQQKEEIAAQRDNIEQQNKLLSEKNHRIQSQALQLQHKNEDIMAGIQYARRIQEAILPPASQLKNWLQDGFAWVKPRDMVSGDFYWFSQVSATPTELLGVAPAATKAEGLRTQARSAQINAISKPRTPIGTPTEVSKISGGQPPLAHNTIRKTIVAAVDCTGHGVPGALMSMIGDVFLNQIVHTQQISSPEHILGELHRLVRKSLHQEQNQNRDGMDIALVTIDHATNLMEFAGARSPIVYIQNKELHYLKGDLHPIGGHERGAERYYTKHQIVLTPDTVVYLFSDGFQDQFGGKNDRKFMSRRFRELLLEIHELPLAEQQKTLEHTFSQWMGARFQVDDVLVIGFKPYTPQTTV